MALDITQQQILSAPLEMEEIKSAINKMKNGKAAEFDGFTIE